MVKHTQGQHAEPATPAPGQDDLVVELRIIELFGQASIITIGPTDVQRLLGVPKGTASSRMKSLCRHGYLHEIGEGAGKYQLGPRLATAWIQYMGLMARNVSSSMAVVRESLQPVLDMLQSMTDTCQPTPAARSQEAQA